MTLTVEDGSIVTGANSYISLAEARAYATARGVTLSAVDAELEPLIIKATDYLESFAERYKGEVVEYDQPLSWPRLYADFRGYEIDATTIPESLKRAQMQAVIEINNGVDLLPTETGARVKREEVGPIKTEYDTARSPALPNMPMLESILGPLLKAGGFSYVTRRA